MPKLKNPLLDRLESAYQVCHSCGTTYGEQKPGLSSNWMGPCDVCGEYSSVTEARDYRYLQKGIAAEKAAKTPKISYEQGEIVLKLTEDEVGFLNECLDVIVDNHEELCPGHSSENPETVKLFESIEKKITDLYEDHCVKYSLSPALKAYHEKYNSWGTGEDEERWEIFRDAYNLALGEVK